MTIHMHAKYRTRSFVSSRSKISHPTMEMAKTPATNGPLSFMRSEKYEMRHMVTNATAYGGTVYS